MKLLVVEDNKDLQASLVNALEVMGYNVDAVDNGNDAIEYALSVSYDVILLDIMLPEKNGYEVIETLRNHGNQTNVLFLSAKGALDDRVKALDLGGDDYLVKPFELEELLARLRVLGRRASGQSQNTIAIYNLEIDTAGRSVKQAGQTLDLSQKEFDILLYLARHENTVMTREQILDHVWDFDYAGGSNIVDVYINYLRKKIDDDPKASLIQTVRGVGYVMRKPS